MDGDGFTEIMDALQGVHNRLEDGARTMGALTNQVGDVQVRSARIEQQAVLTNGRVTELEVQQRIADALRDREVTERAAADGARQAAETRRWDRRWGPLQNGRRRPGAAPGRSGPRTTHPVAAIRR